MAPGTWVIDAGPNQQLPWAGQTVRLRIATADNQAPMHASIDNVRLIPIDR